MTISQRFRGPVVGLHLLPGALLFAALLLAAGRLSLKGLTRDCVVPIAITRDATGNRVAQGSFALKRLDYRIGEGEWADPGTVANDVIVRVRMVLMPAA